MRLFFRPLMGLAVTAFVGLGTYGVATAPSAFAETHSNCVSFDSSGNITGVTPNCSETFHSPSGSSSNPGADPCNPTDTGTITMNNTQDVFHVTVNGAGDVWLTNTDSGTVSFVPDDSTMAGGSGHWTAWFGGSLNRNSAVLHSTFNIAVHLSDGTTLTSHETVHMSMSASGVQISFDKLVLTCG
jgi:hypothetical protein